MIHPSFSRADDCCLGTVFVTFTVTPFIIYLGILGGSKDVLGHAALRLLAIEILLALKATGLCSHVLCSKMKVMYEIALFCL